MATKETQMIGTELLSAVIEMQEMIDRYSIPDENGAVVWFGNRETTPWWSNFQAGYWVTVSCDTYEADVFLGEGKFSAFAELERLLIDDLTKEIIPY